MSIKYGSDFSTDQAVDVSGGVSSLGVFKALPMKEISSTESFQ